MTFSGFDCGIIDDPAIPEGLHQPESQRQSGQVFPNASCKRRLRQKCTSRMDSLFDAVRRIKIVHCDVAPDFKEVVDSLRREPIFTHAWRFSANQALFFSSRRERTSPESINS